MHCEHFMQHPVVTAMRTDTAVRAARLMRDSRVGIIPVVDESGRLAGVVTERDLVHEILAGGAPNEVHLSRIARGAVRCRLGDDVVEAEAKMIESGSHYVIVCDDDDRPRGVIGVADLARYEDARRAANVLFQLARNEVRG